MKKKYITYVILGLIVVIGLFAATWYRYTSTVYVATNVEVSNDTTIHFFTKNYINRYLSYNKISLINKQRRDISTNEIEKTLNQHPYIKQSFCNFSWSGELCIKIVQKIPVIRIHQEKKQDYYLDKQGYLIPVLPEALARVCVVTGDIKDSLPKYSSISILALEDSIKDKTLLDDICKIGEYLQKDAFLQAQIGQIVITPKQEIVAIPTIGEHIIVLGNAEDIQEKMFNLKAFYKEGINKVGWNYYKVINVNYKNQIVCTKINDIYGF